MAIPVLMALFQFAGLILGIIGLILGIVGAVRDETKAPGIVGIVFGAIGLGIAIFFLTMVPMIA